MRWRHIEAHRVHHGGKLTSVTTASSTKSYTYDSAGRTTSVTTSAGTTSLSYDYEDRIVQISYPGGGTNTFTYNGLDTRVGKTDSSGTKSYRRDGVDVTSPVLNDSSASYTPEISQRAGGVSTFQHTGLQNADFQSNSSQSGTAARTYDAFGNVISSSGTWAGPFGYNGNAGYQEDPDSGLKLFGHTGNTT